MRAIGLSLAFVIAPMAVAFAQTRNVDADVSFLLRVPDLSPSLTDAESRARFDPWMERVKKVMKGVSADFAGLYAGARGALAPRLPQVTKMTLYSLYPRDSGNLAKHLEKGEERIKKLPLFHDYPILGLVVLDNAEEAQHWTDFLRDQIVPGGEFACDFMPRHGFRLSTAQGEVDILMCFSCDQLVLFDGKTFDPEFNPVFSPVVKDLLNQLFDKHKIERDVPRND